jgi:hypothetical protein
MPAFTQLLMDFWKRPLALARPGKGQAEPGETGWSSIGLSVARAQWFFGILLVSLAVQLSFAYVSRRHLTPTMLEADEREYYEIAGDLAAGRYEVNPRRTLGFPAVLCVLRMGLGDGILPLQIAISAAFSCVAPLTYWLATRVLRYHRAAVLAGMMAAFWPPFLYYGASLYSEPLALPVFVATLVALSYAGVRPERWLVAGILLGLCMHLRPMYLLYLPFAILVAIASGPRGWGAGTRLAMLFAGCLGVVLPWSVWISLHERQPIFLSCNGGETLGGGLNPVLVAMQRRGSTERVNTPGSGREIWAGPGKWLPISQNGYLSEEEQQLPYREQSDRIMRRTISWLRAHSTDAAQLELQKLRYQWGLIPLDRRWLSLAVLNVPTVLAVAIAVLSLFVHRSFGWQLLLLWTLPLFASLVALVSWGSWRFRLPGDIGVLILAAAWPFASGVRRALAPTGPATLGAAGVPGRP